MCVCVCVEFLSRVTFRLSFRKRCLFFLVSLTPAQEEHTRASTKPPRAHDPSKNKAKINKKNARHKINKKLLIFVCFLRFAEGGVTIKNGEGCMHRTENRRRAVGCLCRSLPSSSPRSSSVFANVFVSRAFTLPLVEIFCLLAIVGLPLPVLSSAHSLSDN